MVGVGLRRCGAGCPCCPCPLRKRCHVHGCRCHRGSPRGEGLPPREGTDLDRPAGRGGGVAPDSQVGEALELRDQLLSRQGVERWAVAVAAHRRELRAASLQGVFTVTVRPCRGEIHATRDATRMSRGLAAERGPRKIRAAPGAPWSRHWSASRSPTRSPRCPPRIPPPSPLRSPTPGRAVPRAS